MLCKMIDGKMAEGSDRIAPQSYVITTAQLLAEIFRLCLVTTLGAAFTQYLWYILRKKPLHVSSIDTLFSLRQYPFFIFNRAAFRDAPILTGVAILIYTMAIATSFPPGSITVALENAKMPVNITVPVFNASYVS